MLRLPYDLREPGHLEVDLVHHCGPSASGEYVHTIQMVEELFSLPNGTPGVTGDVYQTLQVLQVCASSSHPVTLSFERTTYSR